MQFQFDTTYAGRVGEHFGKYLTTFISNRAEVLAHLFEEINGDLIAYVSFIAGVSGETVGDDYLEPLNEFAREQGFEGRLHVRYI